MVLRCIGVIVYLHAGLVQFFAIVVVQGVMALALLPMTSHGHHVLGQGVDNMDSTD